MESPEDSKDLVLNMADLPHQDANYENGST